MAGLTMSEYSMCDCFGQLCAVLAGHPFDTSKVLHQTSDCKGAFDCIRQTLMNEGYGGLYKGLKPALLLAMPAYVLTTAGYAAGTQVFNMNHTVANPLQILSAGVVCGLLTTVIVAPGERIKCLLQVQRNGADHKYNGMVDCVSKLYREGGITNIYRGTVATLLRDIPLATFFFLSYNKIQLLIHTTEEEREKKTASIMTTIVFASLVSTLVALPADLLKSRMQTTHHDKYPGGTAQVFTELIKNEGPFALSRGITSVFLRTIHASIGYSIGFYVLSVMATSFR